jgi:HD-GYP domain-containing protein (c-di-GMP phosphodiesterase class II)
METCRLSTIHVRLGVPLPGNVYDSAGQLLLSKGHVLDSQSQIDLLLARGMYVELSVFEAMFKPLSSGAATVIEKKFDPFLVRNTLKISLNRLQRGVLDGSVTAAQIVDFANQLQAFTHNDAEAAIAASLLDHQEESCTVAHSLNVATLCALLARRLDWPEQRRSSAVCAALTMNLGMFDLQQRLTRQATPLTAAQLAQVHAHPEASLAALQQVGVNDPVWLEAVRQHHEKPTGAGYPQQASEPVVESQLLRLFDVFAARAVARADRRPLAPAQIVRALFVEEGQGPGGALVAALVKMFGLYPPGSFVKLENNELAVVFRADPENNSQTVAAVTTASGAPTMQPVRRDTSRKGFSIASAIVYDKVSIGYDLGKLWITKAHG